MNLTIPRGFVQVSETTFLHLLSGLNWTRDGWGDGEYYDAIGWDRPIPESLAFDQTIGEMRPRHVGVRLLRGEYWIDPTFFKPLAGSSTCNPCPSLTSQP